MACKWSSMGQGSQMLCKGSEVKGPPSLCFGTKILPCVRPQHFGHTVPCARSIKTCGSPSAGPGSNFAKCTSALNMRCTLWKHSVIIQRTMQFQHKDWHCAKAKGGSGKVRVGGGTPSLTLMIASYETPNSSGGFKESASLFLSLDSLDSLAVPRPVTMVPVLHPVTNVHGLLQCQFSWVVLQCTPQTFCCWFSCCYPQGMSELTPTQLAPYYWCGNCCVDRGTNGFSIRWAYV